MRKDTEHRKGGNKLNAESKGFCEVRKKWIVVSRLVDYKSLYSGGCPKNETNPYIFSGAEDNKDSFLKQFLLHFKVHHSNKSRWFSTKILFTEPKFVRNLACSIGCCSSRTSVRRLEELVNVTKQADWAIIVLIFLSHVFSFLQQNGFRLIPAAAAGDGVLSQVPIKPDEKSPPKFVPNHWWAQCWCHRCPELFHSSIQWLHPPHCWLLQERSLLGGVETWRKQIYVTFSTYLFHICSVRDPTSIFML